MTSRADALTFLEEVAARGVEIRAEGGTLLFRPPSLLTDQDRQRARALKPQLLELLAQSAPDLVLMVLCDSMTLEDARYLREERAAILEHLAGLPRAEAERRAGL